MNDNINHLLLFDGVCNLCNGLVQFIIKRDKAGKFKFASLQSVSGQQLLKKHGLPVNDHDSLVYIHNGQYFLRSTACLMILQELGWCWKIFHIFMFIPRPARDFLYNIIARSRYKIFGMREKCMIPAPDIKKRFLD